MNVLVINGSPKGNRSITLQTIKFLEIHYPKDHFTIYNAALKIRAIEKDPSEIISLIQANDLVIFSYPVYTFMAPAQIHQLIACLKAQGCDFAGKPMTQLTTSKHFYDVTAHAYVRENCQELGFYVLPGLSADMEDLPKKEGQKQARDFWIHTHWLLKGRPLPKVKKDKYTITILSDHKEEDTSLRSLIRRFQEIFPCQVKLMNLNDFPFQGACLGCLKCAATGQCVYKDGFDRYLREEVQGNDGVIYAFTIKDHSMGPLFKTFDDRQFCNGHRTVTMGKPFGYLISGDYEAEQNLQMILEARAQVGGNYLAGIVSDADAFSSDTDRIVSGTDAFSSEADGIDAALQSLSDEILFALEHKYLPPQNFYGAGGMRIFRDLIYLMQGLMKQDHRYFKAHGQYDYPQNKPGTILAMYLVGILFSNPKLMQKMSKQINDGMLSPYTKVLKEAAKEKSMKDKLAPNRAAKGKVAKEKKRSKRSHRSLV